MNEKLSRIDWDVELAEIRSVDDQWNYLENCLMPLMDQYIPKTCKKGCKHKF